MAVSCELSLLVPAFDEQANLAAHLPILAEQAAACSPDWEILVVDDGSQDDTPALVERLARRQTRLRLVRHPRNLGPGSAIPTGLFWARGRWLLFVPADLGCEPGELPRLWRARAGADLVVGLRSDRRDYGPWRRLLSVAFVGLVRRASGSRVEQFNYLQLYRRAAFETLAVRSRGVFVTAEIILRAEAAGLPIVQQPLRYQPRTRGRASGASPRALARCAFEGLGFAFERALRSGRMETRAIAGQGRCE